MSLPSRASNVAHIIAIKSRAQFTIMSSGNVWNVLRVLLLLTLREKSTACTLYQRLEAIFN
jgi:hypothetical protein